LIYKCGGIDKRTIEKFEKVRYTFLLPAAPASAFCVRDASFGAYRSRRGIFGGVVRAFLQTCASLLSALGNLNTMPHTHILHREHHDFGHGLRHPSPLSHIFQYADYLHRKPPNSARVPSSTHGFLTSSRPSVSVVSPSISLSGSSKHPSTTSLLSMLPVTAISSRT
jgi:hypothetical protein